MCKNSRGGVVETEIEECEVADGNDGGPVAVGEEGKEGGREGGKEGRVGLGLMCF